MARELLLDHSVQRSELIMTRNLYACQCCGRYKKLKPSKVECPAMFLANNEEYVRSEHVVGASEGDMV